jgi:Tol biopolymer transport system component/dienelactone hydrolase
MRLRHSLRFLATVAVGSLTLAALVLTPVSGRVAQAPQTPAVITPPDSLVLQGMPPVPARIADAMAPYSLYRRAVFRSWHPTRREMLIATRFGDTDQIHRVSMPGGARTQLTFVAGGLGGGQRAPYGATWQQATGDAFVYQKDVGGNEAFQNYRFDLASGVTTLVTDGASRNTLGVWSRAGDRLAYASTRRTSKDFDLYVVTPSDPKSDRRIADLEGSWDAVEWTPDDKAILAIQVISAGESYLWRVDVASGEKTLLTPKGPQPVSYRGAALSPDGKGLYLTTDRDAEFLRLARLDLATGQTTVLTAAGRGDVESFALSPDGAVIAFVVNEEGLGALHLHDVATGRERPMPKLPPGIVSNLQWHRDGVDLAFDFRSVKTAGDVYSLNVRTGAVDRWTTSESGGLNPDALADPEIVRWKSFDGLTISGVLYRPPARFAGKRPVMINIHGGPEREMSRPTWIGFSNYFLNEMGVAIVYPNFRGSWGFGKKFRDLDNGVLRENATKDIGALLDWIAARPDLDKDRVMITGASFGGYLTLAAFTTYNDRIRCAFAGFPISNIVTELEGIDASRRDGRRVEYGDERDPQVREVLNRIAPANNADKIKKPLFLAHGQNDPRVPVAESEQMAAAVRQNGTPLWFMIAKDEGHGISRQPNVAYLTHAWAFFMEQYLLK